MRRYLSIIGAGLVALAVATPAQAVSLYEFKATGTVSSVVLGSGTLINTGDAASLTFQFDADRLPTSSTSISTSTRNRYDDPFIGDIVGVFGALTFRSPGPGGNILIEQNAFTGGNRFSVFTPGNADAGTSVVGSQLQLVLNDMDRTALTSGAIPLMLDLADFQGSNDTAFIRVGAGTLAGGLLFGTADATINSVSITKVSAVPLPASLLLLLTGLGGLAVMRRRTVQKQVSDL